MSATLRRGLALTRELAFGVLAVTGCLVIQCLIVVFIALSKAQIEFVLLQARLLRQIYYQNTDGSSAKRQSETTKTEAPPPPPTLQAKLRPRAQDTLPPQAHFAEPSSIKATQPESKLPAATPQWQTKSVTKQKPGNGRRYATKQVESFLPAFPQHSEVTKPAQESPTPVSPFDATSKGSGRNPKSILPTLSASSHHLSSTAPSTWPVAQSSAVSAANSALIGLADGSAWANSVEGHGNSPATFNDEQQSAATPRMKFAKRSLIKKVVEQPTTEAIEHKNVSGDTSAEFLEVGRNVATASRSSDVYESIQAAPLSHLLPSFKETAVLKDQLSEQQRPAEQVFKVPVGPEEAAREALIAAWFERESARKMLSTNYSQEHAKAFDFIAKEYNEKRDELAALMPSGQLSFADEVSFPYLSTKDTLEPAQACAKPEQPSPPLSPVAVNTDSDAYSSLRKDPGPLITKASRAYQVLLQATKNTTKECTVCHSKFCGNAYSAAGKPKLKAAKDLYQRTRSSLMENYGDDAMPETLAKQLPAIIEC